MIGNKSKIWLEMRSFINHTAYNILQKSPLKKPSLRVTLQNQFMGLYWLAFLLMACKSPRCGGALMLCSRWENAHLFTSPSQAHLRKCRKTLQSPALSLLFCRYLSSASSLSAARISTCFFFQVALATLLKQKLRSVLHKVAPQQNYPFISRGISSSNRQKVALEHVQTDVQIEAANALFLNVHYVRKHGTMYCCSATKGRF